MKEFIVEGNNMNGYWYDVYCFMEENNCNKATAMVCVEMIYDNDDEIRERKMKK